MMPVVHQLRCTSQAFPLAGKSGCDLTGESLGWGIPWNTQPTEHEHGKIDMPLTQKNRLQNKINKQLPKESRRHSQQLPKKNQWNLPRTINNWWSPAKQNQPLKVTKDPIHMLRYQKPTMKVPTKHADTACQAENISIVFGTTRTPHLGCHRHQDDITICRYSNPKHPTNSFATRLDPRQIQVWS